ncbi:hypothetical protein VMCG_05987 [Cytospora schulzeri]|uniref:Aminoglycoside phosphotransferase domain-containing protein n=1 Tax=Cytospora schulzeri TaxID=448051 RepID=A0A423WD76_9PEZI|nr:hypothetical protein VMCG_05987 [Valsa malicola]
MVSTCDLGTLPLDGVDHTAVSNSDLVAFYDTCPVVWEGDLGSSTKVVRVSQTLVLKGKSFTRPTIEGNHTLASTYETFRVPRIHRVFEAQPVDTNESPGWFILMDYVPGRCVRDCWEELDQQTKERVAGKVAHAILEMQSKRLAHDTAPGPVDRPKDTNPDEPETFHGPWFSAYGGGPFNTVPELEAWYNHKLDVCLRLKKAPTDTPRFDFSEGLVLTHQDITPRNLVLGPRAGDSSGDDFDLWIIDWDYAGAYPPGFEQAALVLQCSDVPGFSDMVLGSLPADHVRAELLTQRWAINYGLTTGAFL